MTQTSDPVARTRAQLRLAITYAEAELRRYRIERKDDDVMEVERELRYLRSQLASLNECFS